MIDFEMTEEMKNSQKMTREFVEKTFRPIARKYDENEHQIAEELQFMASMRQTTRRTKSEKSEVKEVTDDKIGRGIMSMMSTEEIAWGDLGLMLANPGNGLGNAAIAAVATDEQFERFGGRYAAMAITEPGSGSDSGSISTTAVLDGDEWILNGEKIFVTDGKQCDIVVVWATLDKKAGKSGIKSFVVEKDRPGITVTKLEHKLGIRASDTAVVVLQDCRIPKDNILGSPEVKTKTDGFKGVMKTFDNTRPLVAIMSVGTARAALDFTRDTLEKAGVEIRYNVGLHQLSAIEKDVIVMEAELEAMRLLAHRAAWMGDNNRHNALEASMAKAKCGRMGTKIAMKCLELLGPVGYSREHLLEKWVRDVKINDIYEGTQQIQQLVVARNILGFGSDKLK